MKTITIELSIESTQKALDYFENYKKRYFAMMDEICKRLAEYGLTNATAYFSEALYDGVKDVSVSVKKIRNGYSLIANGSTVLFLEFGTGIWWADDHPLAGELGMVRGSYGMGLGNNEWWIYSGQPGNAGGKLVEDPKTGRVHPNSTITHGNPANMPMYNAAQDMRRQIRRIAKEVFNGK